MGWAGSVIESELVLGSKNENNYFFIAKTYATSSYLDNVLLVPIDLKNKKVGPIKNLFEKKRSSEGFAISPINCKNRRWLINGIVDNSETVEIYATEFRGNDVGTPKLIYNLINVTNGSLGIIAGIDISPDGKTLALSTFKNDSKKQVLLFDFNNETGNISNERPYFSLNNNFLYPIVDFTNDNKNVLIMSGGATGIPTNIFSCPVKDVETDISKCKLITNIPEGSIDMEVGPNDKLYVLPAVNSDYLLEINNLSSTPTFTKLKPGNFRFGTAIPDHINDLYFDASSFPDSILISDSSPCQNQSIKASVNTTELFSYSWFWGKNYIGDTKDVSFNVGANDTLYLTMTNASGCEEVYSQFIEIKPFESAEFTIDVDPCDNTITVNPKVFEGTYLVRDEFGNEVGKYTDNVFKVKPGDYQIEHLLNAGTPCASLFIQVVSLKPIEDFPVFKIKNAPPSLCEGDSLNMSVAINSTFKTEWILDGNIIASGNDLKFTPKTDALFVVKITSPNGCIKYDTAMVKIVKSSDPKFEINYDACKNNVIIIPITKGGFVTIFDNQNNEIRKTDSLAFDLPSGKYKFTYELNAGLECSSEESKIIDLPNSAVLNRIISSSKDSICIGADNEIIFSISLSNNENIVWNLSDGIILGQEPSIITNPTKSDTIIATVTNSFGCSKIFKKPFYVGNKIDPAFEYKYDVCTKNTTIIGPTGNTTIIVRDEKDSLVLKTNDASFNLIEGNYTIELITNPSQYCEARFSKKIEIEPIIDLGNPIFSNVFSPNNDNVNDYFCSSNELIISPDNYDLKIYDRWGNLVFKSNDQEMCWDGTINGIACELGVYTYILEYKLLQCDQIIKIKTGDVALVK
jgi:gliding motility-associated-like protein